MESQSWGMQLWQRKGWVQYGEGYYEWVGRASQMRRKGFPRVCSTHGTAWSYKVNVDSNTNGLLT